MKYIINTSVLPNSCLPIKLKEENLIEISNYGSSWKKYIDEYGKLHDSEEYWKQMKKELIHKEA